MKYSIFFLFLFLFGCNTPFVSTGKYQKEITELENRHKVELYQKIKEVVEAKDAQIKQIEYNFQAAMDALYGGRLAFSLLDNNFRPWKIANNRFGEAASYGPPQSKEGLEIQNKLLKEELDETKVSNEELARRYNEAIEKANDAVKLQKEKEEIAKTKDKELVDLKEKHSNEIIAAQSKAIEEQNIAIQKAKDEKDKEAREAIEKNKRIIMITCGSLSLIGLAAAIWLPILKREAAWFSGILGAVALLVPFLQPIHLNVILGLGILYISFLTVEKHWGSEKDKELAQKVNNNLINAVQSIKEKATDTYNSVLKPELEEWNKKYDENGNKVEDKQVSDHIDSVLRDYERK